MYHFICKLYALHFVSVLCWRIECDMLDWNVTSRGLSNLYRLGKPWSVRGRFHDLSFRTIRYRQSNVPLNLYKFLVWPHLDYCSSVWNPMSRTLNCLSESNIDSLVCSLNFEACHMMIDFVSLVFGLFMNVATIELFKLVKGFSSTHWNEFFHKSENNVTSWKLLKNHCHCEARLQFFSQRVINRWNSLSQEDVDATSVNAFKGRLERSRAIFVTKTKTKTTPCPNNFMNREW